MKRLLNILTLVVAVILCSCSFEDKSTYVTAVSPEIVIDTTGIPQKITINRSDRLIVEPKVSREGTPKEKFTYEWLLTQLPGDLFQFSDVIGTEETLNCEITRIPDVNSYGLWFRATDTTTGLMKSIKWNLIIEASSGQGLVVAYTKDNKTSDFALVQDTLFTLNYYDDDNIFIPRKYKFDLFSSKNNKTFDGVINNMFSQTRYHEKRSTYMLHGASDHNAFRISTLEYDLLLEGKELFYDRYVELNIDHYFITSGYAMMVNNGRLMTIPTERSDAMTPSKVGLDVPGDYYVNKYCSDNSSYIAWYDETQGKFLHTATYLNFTKAPLTFTVPEGSKIFDPNNMPGYKVLAGGYGNKSDHRFILKKDNQIKLYTLNRTNPFATRSEIDLSNAPEIDKAIDFLILRDQETLLYATKNNVYSVIFTADQPIYQLFYNTPENITNLEMLRKTGTKGVPYAEKCVLIITDQNNNGKIHAIKLGNINSGLPIDEVTILSGFNGRITAVAVQD